MAFAMAGAEVKCWKLPALAAQVFTAVDAEISVGPPDIPKVLDVLKRNGVSVAA